MHFSRKILILFIILLASLILWNLFLKRQELVRNMVSVEGFTVYPKFTIFPLLPLFPTIDQQMGYELDSITSASSVSIVGINTSYFDQPINQFCIKGSYNSAVTGTFVNKDAIKYLLSRGCRHIDLEIFSIDGKAQVAYTTDPGYNMIDTYNSVVLDDVFNIIANRAFNTFSPNGGDPLFINLRIKSNDPDIYNKVASSIHAGLAIFETLYKYDNNNNKVSPVSNATTIKELMSKIVIIMDKTVNPNYANICDQTKKTGTYDLRDYIHMEGGSSLLFIHQYNELLGQTGIEINPDTNNRCSVCTDIRQLRMALPDTEYKLQPNVLVDDYVKKYACQFVPFKFYSLDRNLKDYENMFNFHNSAIVPMSRVITYIKNKYAPVL